MSVDKNWLLRGVFQLESRRTRHTFTKGVREELARALRVAPGSLYIAQYPVAAAFRHTFWWRTGTVDYAEAQFFARIAADYLVLSLGVSVEKGYEKTRRLKSRPKPSQIMNRSTWDWRRFVARSELVLRRMLPSLAEKLQRPIVLRVSTASTSPEDDRTYTCMSGTWYRRHVGKVPASDARDHIAALDRKRDVWVNVYMGCDFGPDEADGKTPTEVAALLLSFNSIREILRDR